MNTKPFIRRKDRSIFTGGRTAKTNTSLYTIEGSLKGYIHNIQTNQSFYVGGTGNMYDYYATEIQSGGNTDPLISLSQSSLSFSAQPGETALPEQITVTVANGGASGTPLNTIAVSGAPEWLTITTGGSGNNQTITNTIDMSKISESKTYTATITVSVSNAVPSSKTYSVTLVVVSREPYGDDPALVPGTIQAEFFDKGGEGIGYHDADPENHGGKLRTSEGVDIEACSDIGGGYNVGYIIDGEWLAYTVSVAAAGSYDFEFRIAAQSGGGLLHVEAGGQDISGPVAVPATGGWALWQSVVKTGIGLDAGTQTLYFVFDNGGFNLNHVDISMSAETVPIVVLEPTAQSTVAVGQILRVEWDAQCEIVPGVKVELSVDGGETWSLIETSGSLGCGSQAWEWTVRESVINANTGSMVSTVSDACVIRVSNYMGPQNALSPHFQIVEDLATLTNQAGGNGSRHMVRRTPDGIVILSSDGTLRTVHAYTLDGKRVLSRKSDGTGNLFLSRDECAPGMLCIIVNEDDSHQSYRTIIGN